MSNVMLSEKFRTKQATIGIIGLGYVGLPLALRFTECGFKVLGFDIDDSKIKSLAKGESYIGTISSERVNASVKKGLSATSDFTKANLPDALIICVPTPLNEHREPDISFIVNTMESILPYLRKGQLLSLESTTYPGTTEEEIVAPLEQKGFKVGADIYVCFSPEREDPGNKNFTTHNIPKVCSGHTPNCLEVSLAMYGAIIDRVVPVSSTKVAEMTKLLENIHRAVNVGLVNELKIVADKMNIDIFEVIQAASTKSFGFTPYYPGPGLGGHCIPIDPFYLTWKAREYGISTRFIELAGEVNGRMPEWVVEKVSDALNSQSKSVKGSKILVLGLAYKKNVDDTRESPSLEIMRHLWDKGAHLEYSDPHVPFFKGTRRHRYELKSLELQESTLTQFDLVLIVTDHDKFNYDLVKKYSKLIVDTRGVYSNGKGGPNIISA
jgi:UDP-N-acetyl-D-glucosamine dehydrogenase